MTAPPIQAAPPTSAIDPENGGRVYIHPITLEVFVSATTALGIINKDALPLWYGKQAAVAAVGNLARLNAAATRPLCDGQHCGECLICLMREIQYAGEVARDAAADRGTRFHHVAEWYALTEQWIPYDADIAPHVDQFKRFIDIYQVTFRAAEVTVINRAHTYAGTLDTVITCGRMPPKHFDLIDVPLYADYKTGSVYGQAALQLAAYRNAEAVLLPDGSERPMPGAHTETALSIQIHADNFWVRPCPVGDGVYQKFLRALELWRDINTPDVPLLDRAMCKPRPQAVMPAARPA
jgi:hypothetical protein